MATRSRGPAQAVGGCCSWSWWPRRPRLGCCGWPSGSCPSGLSQDYVHQVRLGLIRRNLLDGRVRSLGVAVARTTNDLTSVKNWISQGVAPLAVGIPLIIGVGVALFLLDPLLLVGLAIPVAVLL